MTSPRESTTNPVPMIVGGNAGAFFDTAILDANATMLRRIPAYVLVSMGAVYRSISGRRYTLAKLWKSRAFRTLRFSARGVAFL